MLVAATTTAAVAPVVICGQRRPLADCICLLPKQLCSCWRRRGGRWQPLPVSALRRRAKEPLSPWKLLRVA